jgi:hypothetical protein
METAMETEPDIVAANLGTLLVLAALFELGLGVLFNWRVWVARFGDKGLEEPITVFLAWILIVTCYETDPVSAIISNTPGKAASPATLWLLGDFLSAMIVAGGASAILQMLKTLGLRDKRSMAIRIDEARHGLAPRAGGLRTTQRNE